MRRRSAQEGEARDGSRDHRRRRPSRRRFEIDGLAGACRAAHSSPRRPESASPRRCRSSAISTTAAPRRCAAPDPACSGWSSTTCRTPFSSSWRSASSRPVRAPPMSVPRQHEREPGASTAGDPLDARARRRRAGARAGDRFVAGRVQGPGRGHAGRTGDASSSRAQGCPSSRRRTRRARARRPPHLLAAGHTGSPSSAA